VATSRPGRAAGVLARLLTEGSTGVEPTDGELVRAFVDRTSPAAFGELVRRHGSMVLGVCLRVLRHRQDAEDAFQATFLVLARKAGSVSPPNAVGNWLHGVALQTAVRARAITMKRQRRETVVPSVPEPATREAGWDDVAGVLDEELGRLPTHYRAVLLLCDVEGRTRADAARQLGCPEGSVSSRLSRARATLAKRLTRRGVSLPAGAVALLVGRNATTAGVPAALVTSTVEAVGSLTAGSLLAGGVSPAVTTLTDGVLKTMLVKKIIRTTMVVLALSVAAITGGSLAVGQVAEKPAGNEKPVVETKPLDRPEAMDPELASARRLTAAAYSRDGKWLAVARQDAKSVTLYDTSTWKKSRTLDGMGELSHAVVFSADSSRVFAASNDGVIYSWETKSGKPGPTLDAKAGMCYGLTLSPDGKLLASGHHDQEQVKSAIHLWDPATGKQTRTIASDEFVLPNTIVFTPNGKAIAGGYHATHKKDPDVTGFHGVIEWDVNTGKETTRYETPRITNGAWPVAHALAYTPDGKWLIIGGGEAVQNAPGRSTLYGYLWLFNRQTAKLEKTLLADRNDYVRQLTLSADGSQLYVPANAFLPRAIEVRVRVKPWSEFQCWDTRTWELMWTHSGEEPMHLTAITASPDGSRVGLAASDGFKLLDAKTGKPIDGSTPADSAADKNENPKDKPTSSPKPNQVPDTERAAAVEVKAAPAGKQKVLTPEEATRMAEGSKLIVEFKIESVTRAVLIKSETKTEGWATGHGPDDWCLRPGYRKDMAHARFLAILTPNAIAQLNKAGIRDIEKHFSGKTVRVTGPIVKQDYRGRGTPLEVEIVIDDLSRLEVAK
jgi:RNA polymerase sigma factor (sigma-70 family)